MKKLLLFLLLFVLSGCFQDKYRYTCQDPKHFGDAECQKPACEFTQTCPEYLVAPVLGAKIEGTSSQVVGQPAQQAASNCR
jgi:hypothetical protein